MKYSIITINYNNAKGLRNTIESVVSQTFTDYEFIVIDGGSTDGSSGIIKEFQDRISFWVSERDRGIYHAMNKGIARARGAYLNFMNSGDCFYDKDVLRKVSCRRLWGDMVVGHDYHYSDTLKKGYVSPHPDRLSMLTFYEGTLAHQSTFFKRELFENAAYDETKKYVSDWMFYLQKVVEEGKTVQFIPDIVCRREAGGVSESQQKSSLKEKEACLQAFLPAGILRDYQTLSLLDKTTLYRLFAICEHPRGRKWLTLAVKALIRLCRTQRQRRQP